MISFYEQSLLHFKHRNRPILHLKFQQGEIDRLETLNHLKCLFIPSVRMICWDCLNCSEHWRQTVAFLILRISLSKLSQISVCPPSFTILCLVQQYTPRLHWILTSQLILLAHLTGRGRYCGTSPVQLPLLDEWRNFQLRRTLVSFEVSVHALRYKSVWRQRESTVLINLLILSIWKEFCPAVRN
jgi:hypothetical protein